mmetsp:Transcript_36407/g.67283  ORF Transcript_36407/g.67283 Transcript_36407/m.67283 type:complete len:242 (+) Transcript_36407:126-851(+)
MQATYPGASARAQASQALACRRALKIQPQLDLHPIVKLLAPSLIDYFRIRIVQPVALENVHRRGPVLRIELQERQHELRDLLRILGGEVVLLVQDFLDRPELQLLDVLQVALPIEEVLRVLPGQRELLRHLPKKLLEHGEVVLVPVVVLPRARIEQQVARQQLERDAPQGPDVRGRVVPAPDEHLRGPVLTRLNVLAEVAVRPARIAEVHDHGARLLQHPGVLQVRLVGRAGDGRLGCGQR